MAGKVLKKFARWSILGGTIFFLVATFKQRWQEVAAISLGPTQFRWGALSLAITGIAHLWSGWVWGWILTFFDCQVRRGWLLRVYLQTNLAKYVPGNIWHFYGRIEAVRALGNPLGTATLSVLLEPLLMAAAAAFLAGLTSQISRQYVALQVVIPLVVLAGVHPYVLDPVLQFLNRSKTKTHSQNPTGTSIAPVDAVDAVDVADVADVADATQTGAGAPVTLQRYPWLPLCGELGFVLLRSLGFVAAIAGFVPLTPTLLVTLIGAFSCAWFLGLIVPTPGGLGVFEATASVLLDGFISPGILLGALAIFRLLSIAAEAVTAGVAWSLARRERAA